jgi:ElaB/YqjD/DUF883 family membrane-anchored ribosome-binding protein
MNTSTNNPDNSLSLANEDGAQNAEIQNRLADAFDAAKDTYAKVQKKTVQGVKAMDKAVQERPYHAMIVAFGLGALAGFLLSRRSRD